MDEIRVATRWSENVAAWIVSVRQNAYRELFHDPVFFDLLGPIQGLDVLDAGCGEGSVCRHLAARGARVTGIDIAAPMIEAARSATAAPDSIQYVVDSFTELRTQGTKSYDRVISIMALMDSPRLDSAFRAFRRVLRPSGRLVFSIPHPMTDKPGVSFDRDASDCPAGIFIPDYFVDVPWEDAPFTPDELDNKEFRVPTFPRTVSMYVNTLALAGFRLLEMAEPRPSNEAISAQPPLREWTIAPRYLMIAAEPV